MSAEYLLNPMNLKVLESFFFANTLLAFDYDGTLAPICADPSQAKMTDEMFGILNRLVKLCPVAIITGRSIADMKNLLPSGDYTIIGNHGCEGLQSPEVLDNIRTDYAKWISFLEKNSGELDRLGVFIEKKGLSLTLHYRNSHSPQIAAAVIQHLTSKLPRAIVAPGKYVFNITSELAWHKGNALDRLMLNKNFHFSVYFGDDITDEDVFRFPSNRILSVKIGLEPTRARYYLNRQQEMQTVLSHLVSLFEKTASVH